MARKPFGRKAKSARAKRGRGADAVGAIVEAASRALALPFEPSWHAGVKFNLQLLFDHAGRVDDFPLADDTEPGPVFRA